MNPHDQFESLSQIPGANQRPGSPHVFLMRVLTGTCVLFLLCSGAFAGVTASISGTVKDSTGAVLAGASVTATNTATGVSRTVVSNGEGAYTFSALPAPANYELVVRQ